MPVTLPFLVVTVLMLGLMEACRGVRTKELVTGRARKSVSGRKVVRCILKDETGERKNENEKRERIK